MLQKQCDECNVTQIKVSTFITSLLFAFITVEMDRCQGMNDAEGRIPLIPQTVFCLVGLAVPRLCCGTIKMEIQSSAKSDIIIIATFGRWSRRGRSNMLLSAVQCRMRGLRVVFFR